MEDGCCAHCGDGGNIVLVPLLEYPFTVGFFELYGLIDSFKDIGVLLFHVRSH